MKSIVNIREDAKRLDVIPGAPPNPARLPQGCRFHPRCHLADDRCKTEEPGYTAISEGRWVRCWYAKS
jgi:oligopeptide/dipeptide ABC transporter ATP-binding protein